MYVRPLYVLGAAAAALGLYALVHKTIRYKGDLANPGDKVLVPVGSLPAGSLPAAFPTNVGYVTVNVSTADKDYLNGYVVSYVTQESPLIETPLPVPVGPIHLSRALVTGVYRNNKAIA